MIRKIKTDLPRLTEVTRFFDCTEHTCRCGKRRVFGKVLCDHCVDRKRVQNACSEMRFLFKEHRTHFASVLYSLLKTVLL